MPSGGLRAGAGRKKGKGLNPHTIEEIRARIKSYAIIDRLQRNIDGEIDMAASAVTAALGLLRKSVPDLATIQHTGDPENPLMHHHVIEQRIVDPAD